MKLWLITQDKAVVAAETMDQANGKTHHSDWVDSPNDVEAEYLGEAKDNTTLGLILASHNAEGARASGKES